MANTITLYPQKLMDWIAAGNVPPDDISHNIHVYLEAQGIVLTGVTVWPDGRVDIETEATEAEVRAALQGITPEDLDPNGVKDDAIAAIFTELGAYADAVDAGQTPTAVQTRDAIVGLIRVVERHREHHRPNG